MALPPPSDVETDDDLGRKPQRRGRKPLVKVMVDCEFGGQDFCNDMMAISLVAFDDPSSVPGVVTDVKQLVRQHATFRIRLAKDWAAQALPQTVTWMRRTVPDLLRWLEEPGGLESKEAAEKTAAFVRRLQRDYDVWWTSKPSHVDLGRVSAWLTHHLGAEAPLLGYYGSCLQTMLQQLSKRTGLTRRLITEAITIEQRSLKATPTHHPFQDCLAQIVAYHTVNRLAQLSQAFGSRLRSLRRFVHHYAGNLINEPIPRLPPVPDYWSPLAQADPTADAASAGGGGGGGEGTASFPRVPQPAFGAAAALTGPWSSMPPGAGGMGAGPGGWPPSSGASSVVGGPGAWGCFVPHPIHPQARPRPQAQPLPQPQPRLQPQPGFRLQPQPGFRPQPRLQVQSRPQPAPAAAPRAGSASAPTPTSAAPPARSSKTTTIPGLPKRG